MKKQSELKFGSNLRIEEGIQTLNPSKKKAKNEEESLKEIESEVEEYEELDTSFLQEIMKDDEKFMDMLIKTNDKAVHDIQSGNFKESLNILEKMEKILEFAAINKKILDRNLVIYFVIIEHQRMWVLDKCSKYIDGVIYNLDQSLKQDDALIKESIASKLDSTQRAALRGIKLRKLQFLLKVYLQHCAVLSQLSKHTEALAFAKKSQKTMTTIISECADCCREAQKKVDSPFSMPHSHDEDQTLDLLSKNGALLLDSRRGLDSSTIFRDEVSYLKNILDYAVPFINDVIDTIGGFSGHKDQDLLKKTRKSLFNWKNNPENNEKYLRKEFGKTKLPEELKDENRSLLGVQRQTEWLENLNIGTIMHMKPLKYKDYAQKKEFTNEITKDSLQEKIIFQSLIYFTIATEMRFMEMSNDKSGETKATQEEIRNREGYKNSEIYHLKAIELVCRYVNKPCPYINHLISSYQKHYNQDLETIPEESYYSVSEGATTQEVSREYVGKSILLLDHADEILQRTNLKDFKVEPESNRNKTDRNYEQREQFILSPGIEKKEILEALKEEKVKVSAQLKQDEAQRIKKEIEEAKRKKEIQEEAEMRVRKRFNAKTKRKVTEEDELKNIGIANLSAGSFERGINIASVLSPSNPSSVHHVKENSSKRDKLKENLSDSKYFVKRNYDIPNLNLGKMSQDGIKTQIIADKNAGEPEVGFMSERNVKKNDINKRLEVNSNSPRRAMAEQTDTSINLFFYKNFNKFIQNLYVQDEQGIKRPRLEGKKESKLANNPYSKEIAAANVKKGTQNKRTTAVQSAKIRPNQGLAPGVSKNCSLSFGRANSRDADDIKKRVDISAQIVTDRDKDSSKPTHDERDLKNKLFSKVTKSLSFKAVPNLDFSKMKAEKSKLKHISPRD